MHYHIVLCARLCLQQSEFWKNEKFTFEKKVQDEDVVKKDGDEAERSLLHSYVLSHTHTRTHGPLK